MLLPSPQGRGKMGRPLLALAHVLPFYAAFNIFYAVFCVDVVRSWRLDWWIDRRFPFNLIPMWFFLALSIAVLTLSSFYRWANSVERLKLRYDRTNYFLFLLTLILIVWIILCCHIVHTYYIGDYWLPAIIQNILEGKDILALYWYQIDVFPTLGDTIIIAYVVSFLMLYTAYYRAIRHATQKKYRLIKNKGFAS